MCIVEKARRRPTLGGLSFWVPIYYRPIVVRLGIPNISPTQVRLRLSADVSAHSVILKQAQIMLHLPAFLRL